MSGDEIEEQQRDSFPEEFMGEEGKGDEIEIAEMLRTQEKPMIFDELLVDKLFERRRRRRRRISWGIIIRVALLIWLVVMGATSIYSYNKATRLVKYVEDGRKALILGLRYLEDLEFDMAEKYLLMAINNFTKVDGGPGELKSLYYTNIFLMIYDHIGDRSVISTINYVEYMSGAGIDISKAGNYSISSLRYTDNFYRSLISDNLDEAYGSVSKANESILFMKKSVEAAQEDLKTIPQTGMKPDLYNSLASLRTPILNLSKLNSELERLMGINSLLVNLYSSLFQAVKLFNSSKFDEASRYVESCERDLGELGSKLDETRFEILTVYKIALIGALYYLELTVDSLNEGISSERLDPYQSYVLGNLTLAKYELSLLLK